MDKRISVLLLLSLFCISFASALDIDNIKTPINIEKDLSIIIGDKQIEYNPIWERYQPLEIKNMFGWGKTLFSGAITQHDDVCRIDCQSTMQIYLADDGILVDDIIFETLQDNGKWLEQNIRSYQFSYWGVIDDYETQCIELKEVCNETLNESYCYIPKECSQVKIGSHEGWVNYELGEIVKAGTYELKLDGQKKPSRTVDWIIKTNGEWLNSWATWGATDMYTNLVSQYIFNDANHTTLDDTKETNDGTFNGYTYNDGAVLGAT